MRIGLFIAFLVGTLSLSAQTPVDTLEGWWTMQNGQHFFEDQTTVAMKFMGEEVWAMEDYYTAMVPEKGLPLQVIITAMTKENYMEVYTLEPSPEGCDDE